jgi:hypothetical protein
VEAEIRWHDEFAPILAGLPDDGDHEDVKEEEGRKDADD